MSFPTIDALRESLARPLKGQRSPEYIAKMLHPVPKTTVVDRHKFVIERCAAKRVLEFGASGLLHELIKKAAAEYMGVDRIEGDRVRGFDLDYTGALLPTMSPDPQVIVCGEIIEHLTNPGYFLQRLKAQYGGVPVIITVPNAFSDVGHAHLEHGTENVNIDHVAWYSYRTLRTLLERYGYALEEFHWYNGEPLTAEGLIVVTR